MSSAFLAPVLAVAVVTQAADRTEHAWDAWRHGDISTAAALVDAIVEAGPASDRVRHLRVLTSFVRGDYETAIAEHGRLDADYPDRASLGSVVTEAEVHLGRTEPALGAELDRTIELAFDDDAFLAGVMPAVPVPAASRRRRRPSGATRSSPVSSRRGTRA